ncbi:MAG: DUF6580 family putative transport protein [Christensenella sp.]|uniref:ECF transporter S component n=1 Tax=Christensenella sp. TaxID=1935934 RepID=UPI002B1F2334|nr:ECF transporter S component [Christensenella sp.]MEA5004409.1 DUF6580 family putative transport protein [Christensenella sp.]
MYKVLKWIEPVSLITVPVVLLLCALFEAENAALLSIVVAICALLPFFLRYELKKPRPRDMMPIAVLAAVAVVGRIVFAPFPNFTPVSAVVIVTAVCFGRQSGFLTGALAALASNLFFGQGAWTPWQMYAWGMVGFFAGLLNEKGFFKKDSLIYIYGAVSAFLFGFIMDSWYVVGFVSPITWQGALAAYLAGIPFNLSHCVSTVVFLVLILVPWGKKLRRIKIKFGLQK